MQQMSAAAQDTQQGGVASTGDSRGWQSLWWPREQRLSKGLRSSCRAQDSQAGLLSLPSPTKKRLLKPGTRCRAVGKGAGQQDCVQAGMRNSGKNKKTCPLSALMVSAYPKELKCKGAHWSLYPLLTPVILEGAQYLSYSKNKTKQNKLSISRLGENTTVKNMKCLWRIVRADLATICMNFCSGRK